MGFWHRVYTRIGLLDAAGRGWEVTVSKSTANIVIRTLTALTVLGLVLAAVLYNPVADGEAALFVVSVGGSVVADSGRVFDVALMILRAALGMMIFVHGYNKAFRGGRIAGTGRWFQSMGMRPGKVHAALAAFTEMGAGALLVVGLITQVAAAGLIGLMVVAFWTVHRDKGFMITGEGWEYVALISVMSLVCAMLGPGRISLDSELEIVGRLDGWTGMWIALLLGVGVGAAQLLLFFRPPKPEPAEDG